jgi:hypothetical protein
MPECARAGCRKDERDQVIPVADVLEPNAHLLILAIAAMCHAVADRLEEARAFVAAIRKADRGINIDVCLRTFRFDPDAAALFR